MEGHTRYGWEILMPEFRCPTNWTPREYQLKLLQAMSGIEGVPGSAKKKACIAWGRQMGKDTTCGIFMFREAIRVPGNYFYIFPEAKQARMAFWDKIDKSTGLRLIEQLPQDPAIVKSILKQEMTIYLTNGSTIKIIGLDDNPDKGRGISPTGIVFSEAAYMDPAIFAAIEPAIAMNNAWVIYNSTFKGRNPFWKMFQHALSDDAWYASRVQGMGAEHGDYYAVPEINADYLASLVSSGIMTLDDQLREFACLADIEIKGSYYSDYLLQARKDKRIGDFPYNSSYPVSTFWDIGRADATAIWFTQRRGDKTVFIDYDEEFHTSDPLSSIQMLKDKGYYYDRHVLPADAGAGHYKTFGRSTADVLRDVADAHNLSGDFEVLEKAKSKLEGINLVRRRFSNYFFNEETTEKGLERLELYHKSWDKVNNRFKDDPVHDDNSHCADALRTEAMSEYSTDPFYKMNDIEIITKFDPRKRL